MLWACGWVDLHKGMRATNARQAGMPGLDCCAGAAAASGAHTLQQPAARRTDNKNV